MTVKSIIDIDVNDAKFQRFQSLFEKYQAQLAKTPNVWKNVSKESAVVAQQFERSTAALLAQNEFAREQLEEDKKRLGNLTLQEKLWQSLSKHATSFQQNVAGASKWLLKWGGLLGAGLIGGSLFGLDRLASRTGDARSSAGGLGLSIGQQRSFNLNFGRFFGGDASGFLSGVAGAGSDVSKQSAFAALGVNPNQSTDQLAVATLKALRSKALATPINQLGVLQDSYNLGQFGVSTEDLRRLRGASASEFNAQVGRHGSDKAGLNIADDTAQRWQNLSNQLTRAGEQIDRTLVVGLGKLAGADGPISKLSDAASKFLQTLLKSDDFKSSIDTITTWLDKFSGRISKPEFMSSVEQFTSDIGELAGAVHGIVHPGDAFSDWWKGEKDFVSRKWYTPTGQYRGYLSDVDRRYGLPAGTMDSVFQTESGGRMTGVPNSSAGAIGPMQLMPGTAAQYGVNPNDPHQAGDAAGHYLADLESKYKGDILKALAAYNWGEGNLDKYLAQPGHQGASWASGLPGQVRSYVESTAHIKISFIDTPGGSTPVVASQLAGFAPG